MYYILLIIIIIVLYRKNKDLTKENDELKTSQNNKINFCPNCGFDLINQTKKNKANATNENSINLSPNSSTDINTNNSDTKNQQYVESKYTEREIKNSLILIVGSVLIIISALLFLTTTWNITHNIFKTFIIVLMLIVFLTASYIADKILNLKQTSKAFYYIALAYLPIIALSIALFSLFGKYFSLYGLGRYIYLAISSIIIACIYYYSAKKRESKIIGVASILFTIISVIFMALIITTNKSIILACLSLYTALLSIMYQKNIYYLHESLHQKTVHTLTISLIIVTFYTNIWNIITNNVLISDIILEVTNFFNIYFITNKLSKKESLYKYIYPIFIMFIFYNISYLLESFIIKQLLIITSTIIIYVYDLLKYKSINKESFFEILGGLSILYIETIYYAINNTPLIHTYILSLIVSILSLINYLYTSEKKEYTAFIFSTTIILTTINYLAVKNLSLIYLGYSSLLLVIISLLIKNKHDLKKEFTWTGNITFICTSLLNYHNTVFLTLLYIAYCIVLSIQYYNEKNNWYKIICYIYINVTLVSFLNLINIKNIDTLIKVVPLTTIFFVALENLIKKLDEKTNNNYILIQFIISWILLNIVATSTTNFICIIILDILFVYYINNHNWDKTYLYLPFISAIPYIYTKNILIYNNLNLMYLISFIILAILLYLTYKKKENIYIILFFLYTFFHISNFTESKYISIILVSIGIYILHLIKKDKTKDACKLLLYTNILIIFQMIIFDLKINNISVLKYGSILIWIPILTRKIIKKYEKDYKGLEYIGYIIINLICISNYTSELDGIYFVFLLTIIVIVSYILKYGPIFLISLLAILVNVILLTRTFWLSIPWWLYILMVGGILVGFAIYNEISSKKEVSLKDKIKDKLDL